jgi:hypothetical protein
MTTKTNRAVFYFFPAILLISACMCTSSISEIDPTLAPLPSHTPASEATVTREPTASPTRVVSAPTEVPTVAPGSFADFRLFAAEIDSALQDGNTSFFDEHLTTSSWLCLGEPDIMGVCKDVPADTTLEGIPVTQDWSTYEVYNRADYNNRWETTFADRALKLAALAQRFGENPLMPMAGLAHLAVIGVADENDPSSMNEARVLFFEYHESWSLAGELVTVESAEAWLTNTCERCYDLWTPWPE